MSKAIICVGAVGMAASLLFASRENPAWVLPWLAFAAVLGFGIGIRWKA